MQLLGFPDLSDMVITHGLAILTKDLVVMLVNTSVAILTSHSLDKNVIYM